MTTRLKNLPIIYSNKSRKSAYYKSNWQEVRMSITSKIPEKQTVALVTVSLK